MRKTLVTALALLSCVGMLACGGNKASDTEKPADTKTPGTTEVVGGENTPSTENPGTTETPGTAENPGTTGDVETTPAPTPVPKKKYENLFVFEMKLDGVDYKFPMFYEDFVAKGWTTKSDMKKEVNPGWDDYFDFEYNGMEYKVYMYNPSINKLPLEQCLVIGVDTDLSIEYEYGDVPEGFTQTVVLPGNITSGVSTKEEVLDTYGTPDNSYDYTDYGVIVDVLTYELDYTDRVEIVCRDGVMFSVDMKTESSIEGVDNSHSYAIPDVVANYKAPTGKETDKNRIIGTIDGVAYELPCPVTEFMNHGFVLLDEYWEVVVPANFTADAEFRYKNDTFKVEVANFADYATVIQNCMVTKLSVMPLDTMQISVLGGVEIGTPEADLESLIQGMTYEKESSVHTGTSYGGNNYSIGADYPYGYFYVTTDEDTWTVDAITLRATEKPAYGEGKPTAKEFDITAKPVEPEDSLYSYWFVKDGQKFTLPMWYSELEEMGWTFDGDASVKIKPDQTLPYQTLVKDGFMLETVFYNPTVNTLPASKCLVVQIKIGDDSIPLFGEYDGEITFTKGIRMFESTTEDIIAAYGEPSSVYSDNFWTHLSYYAGKDRGVSFYVMTESGVLETVTMSNKIAKEGGDNSVSYEHDPLVDAYKAPVNTKDIYNGVFALDGVWYQLPCPVKVLMDAGFELLIDEEEAWYPAGSQWSVPFTYNNQLVELGICNFTEKATGIENCHVIYVGADWGSSILDITVLDSITIGSADVDVLHALSGLNYEKDGDGDYFISVPGSTSYDEEGWSYCRIAMKDGYVYFIDVLNSKMP